MMERKTDAPRVRLRRAKAEPAKQDDTKAPAKSKAAAKSKTPAKAKTPAQAKTPAKRGSGVTGRRST